LTDNVKSMKYLNTGVLAFYLFSGDIATIDHDFLKDKQILSAEKNINNLQIEEFDDKDLDGL